MAWAKGKSRGKRASASSVRAIDANLESSIYLVYGVVLCSTSSKYQAVRPKTHL